MSQRRTSYTAQSLFRSTWTGRIRPSLIHVGFTLQSINLMENDAPQFHKCATTILKNSRGQYVRMTKKLGLKLIVDELQDGAVKGKAFVEIWKWNDYFALCFKNNEELYLVAVKGDKLELRKTNSVPHGIRKVNLFLKVNAGMGADHYCIKTANSNSPTKYLVINRSKMIPSRWCVTLSDTQTNGIFTTPPCPCSVNGCPGL